MEPAQGLLTTEGKVEAYKVFMKEKNDANVASMQDQ